MYRETLPGNFPAEPWNTYSNLVFLAIILYWGYKVYGNPGRQLFLAWTLPIIALSYLGGSIYHATRSHEFWLLLDWIPIMFLCMALVIYFICKIAQTRWRRLVLIVLIFGASFLLRILPIPDTIRISLGYVITALTILIPVGLYLYKTLWKNGLWVVFSFILFGVAIYFRSIDLHQTLFPMGTHWLWHFLGGVAVHFMITYIYKDNLLHLSASNVPSND
ncbi:MAG: hypothetical protein AB3N16_11340 [Flavobacteriaceae bacterium]